VGNAMNLYLGLGLAVLLLGGLIGLLLWVRNNGWKAAEAEQAKQGVDNARKAIKIDSGVHRLDDDERKRLLNQRD
jgi:hypothetical protein